MLILTIITDSISTAWSTWFYDQISENRIESINKRAKQGWVYNYWFNRFGKYYDGMYIVIS